MHEWEWLGEKFDIVEFSYMDDVPAVIFFWNFFSSHSILYLVFISIWVRLFLLVCVQMNARNIHT